MISLPVLMNAEVLHLCTCWRIRRTDEIVVLVTDHDSDVIIDGDRYSPVGGFNNSASVAEANLKERSRDIQGIVTSDAITHEDLRKGIYRDAQVTEIVYDWLNGTEVRRRKWWIQDITRSSEDWSASVTGVTSWLQRPNGRVYGRTCDFRLGDVFCRVDIESFKFTGSVTSIVTPYRAFGIDVTQIDHYFSAGVVKFTSGSLMGTKHEIKNHASDTVELWLNTPLNLTVGDEFEIEAGCDGTFETCKSKFDNGLNYGGFPTIPGTSKLYKTPNAKLASD